ncbi:phosphoglycerate dehydrogenase-like enzyme [Bradyrhizobium sp. RT6a]|uniref:D-2-hydroxyacid dehydrogenase n=1 Tax=Bradyrhizobium sp. RT6a TaxID=3156381 RepID=UPI003391A4CE
MTSSTSSAIAAVTVLVHGSEVARRVHERFPTVRVLSAKDTASLESQVADADVIVGSGIDFPPQVLDKARRLRWFQSTSAGIDAILPTCNRIRDLIVTNARGVHGDSIADFVMTGIGMMHWDFPRFMQEQSRKEWHTRPVPPISQKTLGVVGLGSIGAAIARRGKGAGMTVLGTKRDVSAPVEGVDRLLPPNGLAELLQLSDFVVLAVPLVPETTRLIGREQLRLMRRSAFLVNIARGSVVAESELVEELRAGTIAGALLDVFEQEPLPANSPLWTMPNVLVAPHVSGYPSDYSARLFEIFAANLQRFIDKKPLQNVIDLTRGY